jgi:single-strand DNA-binding protein
MFCETGNLTRDPEIKYGSTGNAFVNFSIAVSRKDKNGEEKVSFFDVTAFGSVAENVANSLVKGNRVLVSGRIEQSKWTDKEGNERTSYKVIADEVGASLRFASCLIAKAE